MRRHLPPLLAAVCLAACSAPVATPADPLPDYAASFARGLDRAMLDLGREVRLAFPAGSAEAATASRLLDELAIQVRSQALAWHAVESHAQEMRQVLATPGTQAHRLEGLTRAFRNWHLALLKSPFGDDIGIDLAQEQAIEAAMLGAADEAEAIAVSLPAAERLLEAIRRGGTPLVAQLERTREAILGLHEQSAHAMLTERKALAMRREGWERELAAVAAGVAPRNPDTTAALAESQADWDRLEAQWQEYEAHHRMLEETLRTFGQHVRGLQQAYLEWVVALREVAKALAAGRSAANLRLIEASVADWGS